MRRTTKQLRKHRSLDALFSRYGPFEKRRAGRVQRFTLFSDSLYEILPSHGELCRCSVRNVIWRCPVSVKLLFCAKHCWWTHIRRGCWYAHHVTPYIRHWSRHTSCSWPIFPVAEFKTEKHFLAFIDAVENRDTCVHYRKMRKTKDSPDIRSRSQNLQRRCRASWDHSAETTSPIQLSGGSFIINIPDA
jgi:hypothetical protein